jgi:hypothetical protein
MIYPLPTMATQTGLIKIKKLSRERSGIINNGIKQGTN